VLYLGESIRQFREHWTCTLGIPWPVYPSLVYLFEKIRSSSLEDNVTTKAKDFCLVGKRCSGCCHLSAPLWPIVQFNNLVFTCKLSDSFSFPCCIKNIFISNYFIQKQYNYCRTCFFVCMSICHSIEHLLLLLKTWSIRIFCCLKQKKNSDFLSLYLNAWYWAGSRGQFWGQLWSIFCDATA